MVYTAEQKSEQRRRRAVGRRAAADAKTTGVDPREAKLAAAREESRQVRQLKNCEKALEVLVAKDAKAEKQKEQKGKKRKADTEAGEDGGAEGDADEDGVTFFVEADAHDEEEEAAKKRRRKEAKQAATTVEVSSLDKEGAVTKIKDGQKTSPDFKKRWWNYCDTKLDKVRDPNRHDLIDLLQFFLESEDKPVSSKAEAADIPLSREVEKPKRAAAAVEVQKYEASVLDKAGAITKIKDGQRASHDFKTRWGLYCETNLGNVRDPNKHDLKALLNFLSESEGMPLSSKVEAADIPLSRKVEEAKRPPAAVEVQKHEADLCNDFKRGACTRGSSCRFSHGGAAAAVKPISNRQQRVIDAKLKQQMLIAAADIPLSREVEEPKRAAAAVEVQKYEASALDKAGAITKIKDGQRASHDFKTRWGNYCETKLGNVRDPNKHDLKALLNFLSESEGMPLSSKAEAGDIPLPREVKEAKPAAAAVEVQKCEASALDKAGAITKIKNGQRASPDFKIRWGNYCETKLGNVRDPNKHDLEALLNFLSESEGMQRSSKVEAADMPLSRKVEEPKRAAAAVEAPSLDKDAAVTKIKDRQRTSLDFKSRWWNYCDSKMGKARDPNRHDLAALLQFLSGCEDMPVSSKEADLCNDFKRGTCTRGSSCRFSHDVADIPRPGEAEEAWPAAAAVEVQKCEASTPDKAAAVTKIKDGQRMSPDFKTHWGNYCDTKLGKVRDPNRHDLKALLQFLSESEDLLVSSKAQAADIQLSREVKEAKRTPAEVQKDEASALDKAGAVTQVKTGQRTSTDFKTRWWNFCTTTTGTATEQDGVRDPNRHDLTSLLRFLATESGDVPAAAPAAAPAAVPAATPAAPPADGADEDAETAARRERKEARRAARAAEEVAEAEAATAKQRRKDAKRAAALEADIFGAALEDEAAAAKRRRKAAIAADTDR